MIYKSIDIRITELKDESFEKRLLELLKGSGETYRINVETSEAVYSGTK